MTYAEHRHMTPEEIGTTLSGRVADARPSVSGGGDHARAAVDVPGHAWVDAATVARDELRCDFFDWLSAVDDGDSLTVVAHLWSVSGRHGVLLRTTVPADTPSLASLVEVYPGAAWHERETYEMFGVGFPGPLAPLLLAPEFEGHPLRKSFVLASRVAKPWPGAKEPGESGTGTKRQAVRPPGVPAPGEWGPAGE